MRKDSAQGWGEESQESNQGEARKFRRGLRALVKI